MANPEQITRLTAGEIDDMLCRGEDRTDWSPGDAMTEEKLEAAIHCDEGESDLSTAQPGVPDPTRPLTVWLDVEVSHGLKRRTLTTRCA